MGCVAICRTGQFEFFNLLVATLAGSTKSNLPDRLLEAGRSGKLQVLYQATQRPPLEEFRDARERNA